MRSPARSLAVVTVATLVLFATSVSISAQGTLPDAGSLGPPDWVKPGTRITTYAAAASVAQSYYQLVEDPNGSWEDPTTGKRYRKTDETGEGVGGGSGDGVTEVDVIAVEDGRVVLSSTLYGIDHGTGNLVVVPGAGAEQPGGAVDGLWVHPSALASLHTGSLGGMLVLRGPYSLGDRAYDAVSVVNPTPGAYASWTWDAASGVLLASTTDTQGASSPVGITGQAPPLGNSYLTIGRLLGARDISIPGIGARVPSWGSRPLTLTYSGTYGFVNPVDPMSATGTFPMIAQLDLSPAGATWARYRLSTQVRYPGLDTPSVREGVAGGAGPYWWDPDALASFTIGEKLDTDPYTQATRAVASIDEGPGGTSVTIATRYPGGGIDVTYDVATGIMVRYAATTTGDGVSVELGIDRMP